MCEDLFYKNQVIPLDGVLQEEIGKESRQMHKFGADCTFRRTPEPRGAGHSTLLARGPG